MKITKLLSLFAIVAIILSSKAGLAADLQQSQPAAESAPPAGLAAAPSAEELYKISPDDYVLGDSKAKVTVIEYASMTCSHCADFHNNTYSDIKTKYIDTGKIKFVLRAYPLNEPALRGSMLAMCAGKDKFFKFTDTLFTTQNNWAFSKNYLEVLENIGKLGGISGAEFEKCMANKDIEKQIMQGQFNAKTALNINSTPSIFINGVIYKGQHNPEAFGKALDEALAEKEKETAQAPAAKLAAKKSK